MLPRGVLRFDLSLLADRSRSLVRGLHPMHSKAPAHASTALLLLLGLVFAPAGSAAAQTPQAAVSNGLAASVNPFVGTGKGPGDSENLYPGAVMPFGMVQLSPDTETHGLGYHYYQPVIQGFSMTHMSGVGCSNEGEVFFTATTGPVKTDLKDIASPYSHRNESASPGYYRVKLSRWDVNAELTATERTGMAQFSFPAGRPANIVVPISQTLNHTDASSVRIVGDREMEGYVVNQAFCGVKQPYKVYYAIKFSRSFSSFGTWSGVANKKGSGDANESQSGAQPGAREKGSREASQTTDKQQIGAYATWDAAAAPQTVTAQIGISYVDLRGAKNNLKAEAAGATFVALHTKAEAAWNKALRVVDTSGGTPANRRIFYTALYHSLLMPNIISDEDGRYMGFDDKIHTAAPGRLIYANYSGWDIYRDEMPLVALIAPKRAEDMAESVVLMDKQGGWIGRWPQINVYTNIMAGSPLTTILATTWLDGLHGFDINDGYAAMLRDATQAPPASKPYQGEVGIDSINTLHYVPDDKVSYGSVAQLQEDTLAYASLYRLAKALGKTGDAANLYQRALYYRNLFDPQDKFFRPRDSNGQWVAHFDPAQKDGHGFIEGSGWHYQWLAPADMAWLIHAVGREEFNNRLTAFFNYKEPGWYPQYYNPYNETDLEAPFEFNFSGEPWKSQQAVHRVLSEVYTDTPDGIPGNDDCGAMSSWAVLSMMGIYTVDPASTAYELVSPVFPKIVIHLHAPYAGKEFTIETSAHPDSTPYIQSVELNGHTHTRNWISFKDMSNGGSMHFTLGAAPKKTWGAAPADAPPSLSREKP